MLRISVQSSRALAEARRSVRRRSFSPSPGAAEPGPASAAKLRPIATRRSQLPSSRRIVVKLGSAVVTRGDECGVALGRLASVVEQVSWLHNSGREVVLVTSGAVAVGKQRMQQETLLSQSVRKTLQAGNGSSSHGSQAFEPRACAAAGQAGLMALYESMFAQYGISCAQILVTGHDFAAPDGHTNFQHTMNSLLAMKVVPVINANDTFFPSPQKHADLTDVVSIPDNDQLSAVVANSVEADLLIILSDVDGVLTSPPSDSRSRLLRSYFLEHPPQISFWNKSQVGTGGMQSKLGSAVQAAEGGTAVVIANGTRGEDVILSVVQGRPVGTLVTHNGHSELAIPVDQLADEARRGSQVLQSCSSEQRAAIIHRLADLLQDRQADILAANEKDLQEGAETLSSALYSRLTLSPAKLNSLSQGLHQLAETVLSGDVVREEVRRVLVGEGLELVQRKVPMGVVLVVFESRPDCLPQVAGLAVATGNGLLLKGGSEAEHSNRCLHSLVQEALQPFAPQNTISLVSSREEVEDLLSLEGKIDLAIPRGGRGLVNRMLEMAGSRVPVLGHTEGVCHVYVDQHADMDKALKIVVDSKCSYPAACNAVESVLVHSSLLRTPHFSTLTSSLSNHGVKVYPGPGLAASLPFPSPVATLGQEYGSLECTVEVVTSVGEAIQHINTHGSGHTDCIVTEDAATADQFLSEVDSACVFHNASTRFSDGFRFGLGAEVGISTGRLHARGPVGMDGLMTTQWLLRGEGHTTADFEVSGNHTYLHEPLPLRNQHNPETNCWNGNGIVAKADGQTA